MDGGIGQSMLVPVEGSADVLGCDTRHISDVGLGTGVDMMFVPSPSNSTGLPWLLPIGATGPAVDLYNHSPRARTRSDGCP